MTTAEPSRKKRDSSYFLARARPMRDGHNPANEKPLYLILSLLPMDSIDHSPPTSLFPSLKEFSSPCGVAYPELQFFLISNKATFAGRIIVSLFALGERHTQETQANISAQSHTLCVMGASDRKNSSASCKGIWFRDHDGHIKIPGQWRPRVHTEPSETRWEDLPK